MKLSYHLRFVFGLDRAAQKNAFSKEILRERRKNRADTEKERLQFVHFIQIEALNIVILKY